MSVQPAGDDGTQAALVVLLLLLAALFGVSMQVGDLDRRVSALEGGRVEAP